MKTYAFIFARGGSKQIPKKNITLINNKPLIYYSINLAKKIKKIQKVFVSTDNSEIAKISKKYGAEIIKRPANLARDNTPEWLAWQHAIKYLNSKNDFFDLFLSLPPTSPLRSSSDILNCLNAYNEKFDAVVTIREASRNPWFNMVKLNKNKQLKILIQNKNSNYFRRQDTPLIYDLSTVATLTSPKYILKNKHKFVGKIKGVMVPNERSIDIDNQFDLKIAKLLMKKNER
tara:strand:+ start:325 stop:1017 length:693 start_codon:yes stop_codon:yes gene_type:complete